MQTTWLVPISAGIIVGVALSAYARSGNGFLVGPGMLAFLTMLVLVAIVGITLMVWGGRATLGTQLLSFVATAIVVLFVLAIVWPYPAPEEPVPLDRS